MPSVWIEPAGLALDVKAGDTLFAAARDQGLSWPNACGGHGLCRLCWMDVSAGAENLAAPSAWERASLAALMPMITAEIKTPETVRIACEAIILGDVAVFKADVRRAHPGGRQSPPQSSAAG